MMRKEKVIGIVNDLPNEFEAEQLIEKLLFIEKVEEGLLQVKEGKTVPHEKVVKHLKKKWRK